jgi:hypothetical protein
MPRFLAAQLRSGRCGSIVERRRRELGLAVHETVVPQSYDWGVKA